MEDSSSGLGCRGVEFRPVFLAIAILVGAGGCGVHHGREVATPDVLHTPSPIRTPIPMQTPLLSEDIRALRDQLRAASNEDEIGNALSAIRRKKQAAAGLIPDLLVKLREGWEAGRIVNTICDLGPEGRATLIRLIRREETMAARIYALSEMRRVGGGPWSTDELRTILEAASDPDERVRAAARKTVQKSSKLSPDSVPILLDWYHEKPGPEREELLGPALGSALIYTHNGVRDLIAMQQDPDPGIRRAAREAFQKSPSRLIPYWDVPFFLQTLKQSDEDFYFVARKFIVPVLRSTQNPPSAMLESTNDRERALALGQISVLQKPGTLARILRNALNDPAILVRTEAAISFSSPRLEGVITPEDRTKAQEQLEKALSHFDNPSFRGDIEPALKRLQNLGAASTTVLAALRSSDRKARLRAADALRTATLDSKEKKEAVPLLLAMITNDEHQTRGALVALTTLGERDPSVVPVVRNVLEGKVVQFYTSDIDAMGRGFVQTVAWEVMARNDTPEAGTAVCEMLQGPTMKWNLLLFRAIADLGSNARCALPELKRLFDDTSLPPAPMGRDNRYSLEEIRLYRRQYIAGCLGVFNEEGERAIPVLMEGLHASNPKIQAAAAENIARWGPKASDAITTLVAMLNVPEERMLNATWQYHPVNPVAKALASMGRRALPQLIEALSAERDSVRMGAAQALGIIGPPASEAMPALMHAVESDERMARVYLIALSQYGPPPKETFPLLLKTVNGPFLSARILAIGNLGKMGSAAAKAVPDLKAFAANENENNSLRKAARSALLKIRKDAEKGSKSGPGIESEKGKSADGARQGGDNARDKSARTDASDKSDK